MPVAKDNTILTWNLRKLLRACSALAFLTLAKFEFPYKGVVQTMPSSGVWNQIDMDLLTYKLFDDGDAFSAGIDETLIVGTITNLVGEAVALWAESCIDKQPYHMSSLSSLAWVDELMEGHPGDIKTTLGGTLPIFKALLSTLWKLGFKDLEHVKL
ncbi:hypothetical protein APHAL10511_007963 [Amanita phalloides]|nr:hypothetical protein APHAL10511_007963 [Amanita phalloides]